MLARLEVLRLDRLLRSGNALGDHLGLDGHVLFHAQPQHQLLHFLAAEDAQQIVLQREVEAGAAGVALAAGASAQLVVDAAGFMPLGGYDVQAAQRDYLFVVAVGLLLELGERRQPLFLGHLVGIDVLLAERLAGLHFGVAAQQNVGSAAGHVGRDGDRALAPGLRHDGRFALVILGVQHFQLDAHLL